MNSTDKTAIIIGAGLVGSLWSIYLKQAGYKVDVYERRSDMRLNTISAGKSINLATSYRGWKALDTVGVGDEIRAIALPMFGRTLHNLNGDLAYQPYGSSEQAIYSVSRGELNAKLMTLAEKESQTKFHFNEECIHVDLKAGTASFKNTTTGEISKATADVVFASDGAFSAARYSALQKVDRFTFSQTYIEDGYREILLPANEDGTSKLGTDSLHIWPRGRFMLIALPNFDGSFTCTLFMPFENHEYCFKNLDSKEKVNHFFSEVFPDFYAMMPHVADAWEDHPLSSLALIRCFPWTHEKLALMGDAAHATVPFFGQGMNAGFEDCTVMWELMEKHNEDWPLVFKEYEKSRKPNGDAMQDLSLKNYLVMRDKVMDPMYQLQQKIERRIHDLYPKQYFPLYSMVSFSDIAYAKALQKGTAQGDLILKMIEENHLNDASEIDGIIHEKFKNLI
ncbi:MAG: NAD(P)/FAD-dependent oxidoreductase [Crocinitomicaceae bacterium]